MNNTCRLFLLAILLSAVQPSYAGEVEDIINGGRLYDKWWSVTKVAPPDKTHPAYPAAGKKTGANSWRCKECHGWDYMGKDGTYSSGSHFTGYKGIRGMAGKDPAEIRKRLSGGIHSLSDKLGDAELNALAVFVAKGQMDMDKYIDRKTKQAMGDSARGKQLFKKQCTKCHGEQGDALNLGKKDAPAYLANLASENPWEVLHKIRFGHPDAKMDISKIQGGDSMMAPHNMHMKMWVAMPPMYSRLSEQEQVDILRHVQGLKKAVK